MKFASFKVNNSTSWGVIDGDQALDVGALLRNGIADEG
jgi:hypothetical protein